jgi:hypothetical protein
MLDAAREALFFLEGRTFGDLKRDRMLALSLVRNWRSSARRRVKFQMK